VIIAAKVIKIVEDTTRGSIYSYQNGHFFGGEIMKTKIYYFRHNDLGEKLAGGFFSFFSNLATPIVAFFIIAFAMALSGILKYFSMELMLILFGVSVLIGVFCALKFCFAFKGVILYDSYLEIVTQNLGFGKEKPKIKVNYSDILSIYNSTFNIRYDRRKARKCFIAGDFSYYVELTLNGGKQFCFSVENQEEFVEEVNKRMQECKVSSV